MPILDHFPLMKILADLKLDGEWEPDLELEAKYLDLAQEQIDMLTDEIFPNSTVKLLDRWEKILGITPPIDSDFGYVYDEEGFLVLDEFGNRVVFGDTTRRDWMVEKLLERGGLSSAYFISLAAALGHTIEIEEFRPSRCGVLRAGDRLTGIDWIFVWRITILASAVADLTRMQELCIKLKPAHTIVLFNPYVHVVSDTGLMLVDESGNNVTATGGISNAAVDELNNPIVDEFGNTVIGWEERM